MSRANSAALTPAARRGLRVAAAGVAVRYFGVTFYTPYILAYLHVGLGVSFWLAGLYLALPGAASVLVSLIGGGLADRAPRRPMIVASFAAEIGGIAVFAAGIHFASLGGVLGGLFAASLSSGIGFPAVAAYITDLTTLESRTMGFSWLRTALNVGATSGFGIGGALLDFISFGQLALLGLAVVASGVAVTAVLLPPSPRDLLPAGSPRLPPADGAASGIAPTDRSGGSLAAARAPLRALRRDRSLLTICLAGMFINLLLYQYLYAVPAFALTFLSLPYVFVGAAIALNGAIPALTQVPLTRALTGRRLTTVGLWGLVAYAVAYGVMGVDGSVRSFPTPTLFAVVIIMTFGECLVVFPSLTIPMKIAPEESRGAYAGASSFGRTLGALVAPVYAGLALGLASQPIVTWSLLAIPCVPAALLLWRVSRYVPVATDLV